MKRVLVTAAAIFALAAAAHGAAQVAHDAAGLCLAPELAHVLS